jgi:cellulose synthase (UDP-forming)
MTDGEFIVVYDADFAPRADFLWQTVPYMAAEDVGVVQTAQYFDVDGRVNYIARFAGSLQELFFRWIQPARDTCEAAICAGTNVVYRRSAVAAAGGFAKVPLGEDVHSGVKIWVANYRTRYVPIVLAKGLAPDSWNALTNQQYRWCRSSLLLMVSSFFRDAPFSKKQRVCFWAAFVYYMSSAALPFTSTLPALIMVWFFPTEIHPANYFPLIPSVVSTLVIFPLIARGWRPTIYRVCVVNSFCHLLAVVDALRNQVQAWVPTGAVATTTTSQAVPRRIALLARIWLIRGAASVLAWPRPDVANDVTEPLDPRPKECADGVEGCELLSGHRIGEVGVDDLTDVLGAVLLPDERCQDAERESPLLFGGRRGVWCRRFAATERLSELLEFTNVRLPLRPGLRDEHPAQLDVDGPIVCAQVV